MSERAFHWAWDKLPGARFFFCFLQKNSNSSNIYSPGKKINHGFINPGLTLHLGEKSVDTFMNPRQSLCGRCGSSLQVPKSRTNRGPTPDLHMAMAWARALVPLWGKSSCLWPLQAGHGRFVFYRSSSRPKCLDSTAMARCATAAASASKAIGRSRIDSLNAHRPWGQCNEPLKCGLLILSYHCSMVWLAFWIRSLLVKVFSP